MMRVALAILRAQGRPAEYTAPGGSPVSVRAKIRDADARVRLNSSMAMYDSQALGLMSSADRPMRGGLLFQDGATYRIDGLLQSSVAGLVDLRLTRASGAALQQDFRGAAVLRRERIVLDGVEVAAHVNRSGLLVEEDSWGNAVEVARHIFSVSLEDGATADSRSKVLFEGRELVVQYTLNDGLSSVRLVC